MIKNFIKHIFFSGAVFILCSVTIFGLFKLQPKVYEARTSFFITEKSGQMVNTDLSISKLLTSNYGLGLSASMANELAIIKSRRMSEALADTLLILKNSDPARWNLPVLHQFEDTLRPFTTPDTVAVRIRDKLRAEQTDRGSELITITYQSYSPQEAKLISDLTTLIFNAISTENKRRVAVGAREFLSKQKNRLSWQVNALEDSLQLLQEESYILNPDLQFQQWLTRDYEIQDQLITRQSKLREIDATLEILDSQKQKLTTLMSTHWDKSLAQRLETLQFSISELKTEQILRSIHNGSQTDNTTHYNDNYTEQISFLTSSLNQQIEPLLADSSGLSLALLQSDNSANSIDEMIISIDQKQRENSIKKSEALAAIKNLNEQLGLLSIQIKALPEQMTQLSKMKREIHISDKLYTTVSQQLAEVHLWDNSQSNRAKTLDPSVLPDLPIAPNPLYWFFGGLFFGTAITVCLTYLKIRFDNKISGKGQLLDLDPPFLGAIPHFADLSKPINDPVTINGHRLSSQLAHFLSDDDILLDSLNRLRMKIYHNHMDNPRKVVAITSSNKGEGKSTLSCNLATTLEYFGKRVLLIDLDLHRPTLHKIFDISRRPGLSDLLAGQAEVTDCVYSTPLKNLYVLPAGKKVTDPVKLIESETLRDVIQDLSKSFDYVIIDTPPFGLVTDSAHYMNIMDGLIVAARYNMTNVHELEITLEGLSHINAPVTGTVLTAAPASELPYTKRSIKEYFYAKKSRQKVYDYL